MSIISARCPYLTGYIDAARKSSALSAAAGTTTTATDTWNVRSSNHDGEGDVPKAVVLCLEHASAETVPMLARYLYTDALLSDDASGETLDALAGLAQELMLPR